MIFHPDATLATLRSDVAFMRRFSGNPLNFCRAEIYAGTPLEKRMIALGRARGDYLARVYSLSDPIAALACNTSLDLFESRCWSSGSLMQNAIGLDHLAATLKRFNRKRRASALCRRVGNWLRSVNLDTTDLLEEVINLSASARGYSGSGFSAPSSPSGSVRQRLVSNYSPPVQLFGQNSKYSPSLHGPLSCNCSRDRASAWRDKLQWPCLLSECLRYPDANLV